MKERPILFNGDMVRAMLDGRKTQTRRPVKYTPILEKDKLTNESKFVEMRKYPNDVYYAVFMNPHADNFIFSAKSPYGEPGDRLWVRETFHYEPEWTFEPPVYKASPGPFRRYGYLMHTDEMAWTPSIHMPRWASRINLLIKDVRVERVQEISVYEAMREGIDPVFISGVDIDINDELWPAGERKAIAEFAKLWNSCYGDGAWERNDWVWVYDFEVVKPEGK